MHKIVHHLRKLSTKQKRDVLHVSTFIFAVILLMIWVYTLGQSFSNPNTQIKMKESLKPFNSLKENIVGGYNSLSLPSNIE
jgi:uncharacterized membrane protein YvbJ